MDSFYKHISQCIGKVFLEKMEIKIEFEEFQLVDFNC